MNDLYSTVNSWKAIWQALYDDNILRIKLGDEVIFVKDHLPDGEPVWRRAKEDERHEI